MDEVIATKLVGVAVYDDKSHRFGDLAWFDSSEAAIRAFGDVVMDRRTELGRHPEDYKLVHLANYDKYHGSVDGLNSVVVLASGFDFPNYAPKEDTEVK